MRDLALEPHHDGSSLHVGTSAPSLGEKVELRVRVPRSYAVERVWVRSTPDAEPHYDEAVVDHESDDEVWLRASVTAANPLTRYRFLLGGPGGGYRWLTGMGVHEHDVPDAHDFTLSTYDPAPEWASDALVYQVFPDRFARSAAADARELPDWAVPAAWTDPVEVRMPGVATQVYGGDLDGVREHLDDIEDLGFDTVYLTPFFPARSNHRYDASSFAHVDPLLGGDEALARLTRAAHERGMRVMGDLTTNHSGVSHEWFRAALADPEALERSFYYFRDDGSYLGWYDVPSLPKLRYGPELLQRFAEGPKSVAGHWLQPPFELDGWRVDVANMTGRHLADNANLDLARAMRQTMLAANPDTLLVAEHCHDASGDLSGEGWHGAMNYAGFLRPVWEWLRSPAYEELFLGLPVNVPRLGAGSMYAAMRAFQAVTPWRSLLTSWSLIGSHDTPRARTVMGDRDTVAVAAGLLFTFPGAPMVFMGDEVGGEGAWGEDARRPMPWGDPTMADAVTLERYRSLARLRRGSRALRRGSMRWVAVDDDALVYVRESEDEAFVCLAARGRQAPVTLRASAVGLRAGQSATCVHGGGADLAAGSAGSVTVDPAGTSFQVWQVR